MRRSLVRVVVAAGLGGAFVAGSVAGAFDDDVTAVRLGSPAFGASEPLPARFTCEGQGVSPPLEWFDLPRGTRSLVLIMEELGGGVHWLVYDVAPLRTGFGSDAAPADARVGLNDEGRRRYEAPCGSRSARYVFSIHALDRRLDLEDANAARVRRAMAGHVLAEGTFVVTHAGHRDSP
jgi:Raf kinase inhibitor-like YbhB/YbcL family protein